MLRQINELVDFSFVLEELQNKYCLDNGRWGRATQIPAPFQQILKR